MSKYDPSDKSLDLYRKFWKLDPRRVGEFERGFKIPRRARLAGEAVHVMYRSGKCDPLTHVKPDKPIDYIHEHEKGVRVYRCDSENVGPMVSVPNFITSASELVLLGQSLGFCYRDDTDTEIEAVPRRPYPELYAIPSGRALLVVQDKAEVVALIWGGRLDVEGRGIVH